MSSFFQHNPNCWPDTITANRVMLKKITPTRENAEMLFNAVQNNIYHLKDSFDFLIHKISTVDDALTYLNETQREVNLGRCDNYGVFFEDSFVGVVCILGDKRSEREVLYWLTEEACGHGFMNDALDLVEREHAKSAPYRQLFAIVNEKAKASAALLMRRGYSFSGLSFWKMPSSHDKPGLIAKHLFKIPQKGGRFYG